MKTRKRNTGYVVRAITRPTASKPAETFYLFCFDRSVVLNPAKDGPPEGKSYYDDELTPGLLTRDEGERLLAIVKGENCFDNPELLAIMGNILIRPTRFKSGVGIVLSGDFTATLGFKYVMALFKKEKFIPADKPVG